MPLEQFQRGIQTNEILALSVFSIFASHFSSSLYLSLQNRFRYFTWKIWTVTKNLSLSQNILSLSLFLSLDWEGEVIFICTPVQVVLFQVFNGHGKLDTRPMEQYRELCVGNA